MSRAIISQVHAYSRLATRLLGSAALLLLAGCVAAGPCATRRPVVFGRLCFEANSVVYILQSSGAAIDSWGFMVRLVDDSINRLQPSQRYDVIWVRPGGEPVSILGGLRNPDARNLASVLGVLKKVQPRGGVTLWPAIQMAYARSPDAVVLFASGGDVESDLPAKAVGAGTPRVPIYACGAVTDMDTIRLLSERTGGQYWYVAEEDLQLLIERLGR